jgi:diguanylate cyclase (GGDEF)-like protein/PAS domain S-box-containing protein
MHGAETRRDAAGGRAPTEPFDCLPVGVVRTQRDGTIAYVNAEWERLTGVARADLLGRPLGSVFDVEDRDRIADAIGAATSAGTTQRVRAPLPGQERWCELVLAPDGNGTSVDGFVATLADVTAAVEALRLAEVLEAVLEATPDLVGIADDRGGVAYINPAARECFELGDRDVHTMSTSDMYPPESFELYYSEIRPQLLRGEPWAGLISMRRADGELVDVWQTVVGGVGPGKTIEWIVTVGRDVTEDSRAQADLEYRATHDMLTGLPNRALLLDHLRLALARRDRDVRSVGLVFIDLDDFKTLNDRFGHDAGDAALRDIAQRLAHATRPSDTVARYGGDEFVVLLDGLGNGVEEAAQIANRLIESIAEAPVSFGRRVAITASAGVVVAPTALENPERLITAADRLMYRAKRAGGNQVMTPAES